MQHTSFRVGQHLPRALDDRQVDHLAVERDGAPCPRRRPLVRRDDLAAPTRARSPTARTPRSRSATCAGWMHALPRKPSERREPAVAPRAPRRPGCRARRRSTGPRRPGGGGVERRASSGQEELEAVRPRLEPELERRGRPRRACSAADPRIAADLVGAPRGPSAVSTIATTGGPPGRGRRRASGVAFGNTSASRPELGRRRRGRPRTSGVPAPLTRTRRRPARVPRARGDELARVRPSRPGATASSRSATTASAAGASALRSLRSSLPGAKGASGRSRASRHVRVRQRSR